MDLYEYLKNSGHPRLRHHYVVDSPLPILAILATYAVFVLKIGPALMKYREPYKLKSVIIAYNIIQILCNAGLFLMGVGSAMKINFFCEGLGGETPERIYLAELAVSYLYLKVLDLFDTVFFVLRKKHDQVSFLHVYHHIIMVAFIWVGLRWYPGGSLLYIGYFNTIAHVAMYLYYLMAIWNPSFPNSLFWKKQVTHIQLIQHCMIMISTGASLFSPSCEQPRIISAIALANALFFIYLFTKFYIRAYVHKNIKTK